MVCLLAATQIRLGSPLDAEPLLDEQLAALDREADGAAWREAAFLLGVCYQKSGRPDKALSMFEDVLADDELHWRARFHTALLAIDEAEFEVAADLLLGVLATNPDHAESQRILDKLQERKEAELNLLEPPPT